MSHCIFPGSFDPPTRGHMDLICRAARLFDQVTVAVMVNRAKAGSIPLEARVSMLQKACRDLPNVRVELWKGLLADYVRMQGTEAVVLRGIRNGMECEQELVSAGVNRLLCPGMETILMPAADGLAQVSSSAVREIASFGGDYGFLVPEEIKEDIDMFLHRGIRQDEMTPSEAGNR